MADWEKFKRDLGFDGFSFLMGVMVTMIVLAIVAEVIRG